MVKDAAAEIFELRRFLGAMFARNRQFAEVADQPLDRIDRELNDSAGAAGACAKARVLALCFVDGAVSDDKRRSAIEKFITLVDAAVDAAAQGLARSSIL